MKRRPIIWGAGAIALLLAPLATSFRHWLVWNGTASVPTGLYLIRGKASLHAGERVAVEPPPSLARFMAERRYLPTGLPLLKHVAAVSGQTVCRVELSVTIDGEVIAFARASDSRARPLPQWSGCHRLHSGELFLLNPAAPDSFDGRYFGITRLADVIGRALPVWTDEAGDGSHRLFAPIYPETPPQPNDRSKP